MIRPQDQELAKQIIDNLNYHHNNVRPLPGIQNQASRDCFINQIIDSIRRIRYVFTIRNRQFSELCTDASSPAFDPLNAAVYFNNQGNSNEALWMVFLAIHFGKHYRTGWELVKCLYGGIDYEVIWTWEQSSTNINGLKDWIHENYDELKSRGSFSNHRKFESLRAHTQNGTGATFESYINWVGNGRNHQDVIDTIGDPVIIGDPRRLFKELYKSMSSVIRFGRMAKFDYLTMVGKLGIWNIEPDSPYLNGATGPVPGTKLLFLPNRNQNIRTSVLEGYLFELDQTLGLEFGMQVLEDSICNWQKNPVQYSYFRG